MADFTLAIQTSDSLLYPAVLDGITLEMERRGAPSKLTFTVIKGGSLSFNEGDAVQFAYKGTPMFFGYVFTKKRTKENHITVTAYDQLRYMQNKFTYVFAKKTATQILKLVCDDFGIKTGSLEDTGYTIPTLIEENKTLFDIVLDALDETVLNTGNMFVLYDNYGKLELKNMANMKSNILIDEETAEDFDYTSSIDNDTYNKIVLYYIDKDTNDRIPFSAKSSENIDQWGLLQYFEEVKVPSIGQSKANALLKLYNKKTRELKITGAFGDPSVRAGMLIPVKLSLGDTVVNNFLLIESMRHTFSNDDYRMDLTLNGNWGD